MKIIFLIMTFFMNQFVHAESDKDLFLQGYSYFFNGNFKKAQDSYSQIVQKSSAVWQNLGNSYFNEQNYMKAFICWKRAEQGASINQYSQLFRSEKMACQALGCVHDGITIWFLKCIFKNCSLINLYSFLLLLIIYFLIMWYRIVIKSRKLLYKKFFFLLFLFISILSLVIFVKEKQKLQKQALVIEPQAQLFVGPDKTFAQKNILPLGMLVAVEQEQNGMVKITSSNSSGWTMLSNIEII